MPSLSAQVQQQLPAPSPPTSGLLCVSLVLFVRGTRVATLATPVPDDARPPTILIGTSIHIHCCRLYRYQGYYYYTRTEEGQQYAVHCRRALSPGSGPPSEADEPAADQPEEIILDENKRKQDGKHSFYMVGGIFGSTSVAGTRDSSSYLFGC